MKLVHGLNLLLSLHSCVLKSLILDFDSLYFTLHFLLPVAIFNLTAFMVVILELPDLLELLLFLYLKSSLVDALGQENIKNWLNFFIIVEKIVILNLGDFVNSSLLWNILRFKRFRLENISLQFHFCLFWLLLALLGQEIGEVDIDTSWRTWSQVVWTSGVLGLLELEQLRLNHLNLLLLSFFFDPLIFLHGRS